MLNISHLLDDDDNENGKRILATKCTVLYLETAQVTFFLPSMILKKFITLNWKQWQSVKSQCQAEQYHPVPALNAAVVPLITTRGQCKNMNQSPSGASGKCGTVRQLLPSWLLSAVSTRFSYFKNLSSKSPPANIAVSFLYYMTLYWCEGERSLRSKFRATPLLVKTLKTWILYFN